MTPKYREHLQSEADGARKVYCETVDKMLRDKSLLSQEWWQIDDARLRDPLTMTTAEHDALCAYEDYNVASFRASRDVIQKRFSPLNRMYQTPTVAADWADSRKTHMAVAIAIHAISGPSRSPQQIWEAPTTAEFQHVTMAVEDYLRHGDFEQSIDGRYAWGDECVEIELMEDDS